MSRRARTVVQLVIVALPWRIKRRAYSWFFQWRLHPTSHIGFSMLEADTVVLAAGARIGHFTVIRDLTILEVGTGSLIGNWNWISAAPEFRGHSTTAGTFRIGAESAVTSRHYIDCSGGVEIGTLVTLAGVRSTILTHQINRATSAQTISSVAIGDRSLISSNVKFAPGASVPRDSVVGMGAVVVGRLDQPNCLYAGVPARAVKPLSDGDAYLNRPRGPVTLGPADSAQSVNPSRGPL
jgi:acetyltransferase-like isoleucine patch superfamily enzyme